MFHFLQIFTRRYKIRTSSCVKRWFSFVNTALSPQSNTTCIDWISDIWQRCELSTSHLKRSKALKIRIWLIYVRPDASFVGLPLPKLKENVIKISTSQLLQRIIFITRILIHTARAQEALPILIEAYWFRVSTWQFCATAHAGWLAKLRARKIVTTELERGRDWMKRKEYKQAAR